MNSKLHPDSFQNIRFEYTFQEYIPIPNNEFSYFKDFKSLKMIGDDDNSIAKVISYETTENIYDHSNNIINTIIKDRDQILAEISYENTYDEKGNLVKQVANIYRIETGHDVRILLYENLYDDRDRLIKVVEKYESGEILEIIHFSYSNAKIIKKKAINSYGKNDVHIYSYDNDNRLIEERILINDELSYYYIYSLSKDGTLRKNLISPAKGKYRWKLKYDCSDGETCEISPVDSDLTPDMLIEIMEYILNTFTDRIKLVIIDVLYINLPDINENRRIYDYYLDKYDIRVLENW